jgi:hypothetical protein
LPVTAPVGKQAPLTNRVSVGIEAPLLDGQKLGVDDLYRARPDTSEEP